MNFNIKKNWWVLLILILILIPSAYLRLEDYTGEGFGGDAENTIFAAVFPHNPHSYFPGFVSTEPPLGNYIIGMGCMASGEDFSQVGNVKPLFFPDRFMYIGDAAAKAKGYCFFPIYLFSFLFLLATIIFAFLFFNKKSALYFIGLIAFSSLIIQFSRFLHVEIIFWTFTMLGMLFLWLGYKGNKDLLYFSISFFFFGLGGGTKFTGGATLIFAGLLIIEKYKLELLYLIKLLLEKFDLNYSKKITKFSEKYKPFLYALIIPSAIAFFTLFWVFEFSFYNFFETYRLMTSVNWVGSGSLHLTTGIFTAIYSFLLRSNIFDLIIFILTIPIFFSLLFKRNKTKQEKFAFYLTIFGILVITLYGNTIAPNTGMSYRSFPLLLGFLLMMPLLFSNKNYLFLDNLKFIKSKKFFLVFILIYILFCSFTLISANHSVRGNSLLCKFSEHECNVLVYNELLGSSISDAAIYIKDSLLPNETVYSGYTQIWFYLEHEQALYSYLWREQFKQKYSYTPSIEEYVKYFDVNGKKITYVILSSGNYDNKDKMTLEFMEKYKPTKIISKNGVDTINIYYFGEGGLLLR